MEEDYEGNVDQVAVDTAHAGDTVLDDDLAQDIEGQEAGEESLTDSGDFASQKFAYTGEDGKDIELTGADLLAALQEKNELAARIRELETKPKEAPAPTETKRDEAESTGGLQVDKIGPTFAAMLEGMEGGVEAIGPALVNVVSYLVQQQLGARDQAVEAKTTFTQDFGDFEDAFKDGRMEKFLGDKPFYKQATPYEAYLAMKALDERSEVMKLTAELAAFKSGKGKEVESAAKAGEVSAAKKLLAHKKAAGSLRLLGSTSGLRPVATKKTAYSADDSESRTEAATAALAAFRGGATAS